MNQPLIRDKKYLSDRRRLARAIGFAILLAISIAVMLYVVGYKASVIQGPPGPQGPPGSPGPTVQVEVQDGGQVGTDTNVPTTKPISGTSTPQTGLPKNTSATPAPVVSTPAPTPRPTPRATPQPSPSQPANGILKTIGRGLERLLSTL